MCSLPLTERREKISRLESRGTVCSHLPKGTEVTGSFLKKSVQQMFVWSAICYLSRKWKIWVIWGLRILSPFPPFPHVQDLPRHLRKCSIPPSHSPLGKSLVLLTPLLGFPTALFADSWSLVLQALLSFDLWFRKVSHIVHDGTHYGRYWLTPVFQTC